MATLKETFTNIADAIREKDGSTDKITPANMPQKIRDISSGSSQDSLKLLMDASPNISKWFYDHGGLTSDLLDKVLSFNTTSNLIKMNSMFYNCTKLTSVPLFDTSKVTDMTNMFYNCTKLKEIHMTGMKVNFNITPTALEHDALVEVIGNLATVTNSPKLTMGSTKLALLSDEEKKVATDKGWVLA